MQHCILPNISRGSIPVRVKHCPAHGGSHPVSSTWQHLSVTDTSGTIGSAGSCDPKGRAAYTAAWTYHTAFSCSGPHWKLLFGSLSKWAKVTYPNEDYIASRSQRSPLGIVPLSLDVGGTRYNDLSFTLQEISQHTPHPLDPQKAPEF